MNDLVNFGKAIADPTRVRILRLLTQSECCVCELVDALAVNQSSLSTHLQILRSAGLVATSKRGSWIVYSLKPTAQRALERLFEELPSDGLETVGDDERFTQRVALRVEGLCVLGSGQIERGTQEENNGKMQLQM